MKKIYMEELFVNTKKEKKFSQKELMEENLHIAALQSVPTLGGTTIRYLMSYYGSAKKAWEASNESLQTFVSKGMIGKGTLSRMLEQRKSFSIDLLEKRLEREGIKMCTFIDSQFPVSLASIYNAPAILFCKGNGEFLQKMMAIVGSRQASSYGREVTHYLSRYLGAHGVTVVSGGARGIDTYAHEGALAENGSTIAVLGSGVDIIYPYENKKLFSRICEKGLLVSEYIPGTKAISRNFPARNRIIAGLVQGVVVVEAKSASGSLITADMALSEGRDVYAVPGNIFSPLSGGTHWLLQQGAIPLFQPEQILGEYGWFDKRQTSVVQTDIDKRSLKKLNNQQQKVLEIFSYDTMYTIEDLLKKSSYSLGELHKLLLELKLMNLIEEKDTGGYILLPRR